MSDICFVIKVNRAKKDVISVRGLDDKQTTPDSSVYLSGDEGWLIRRAWFEK